LLRPASPRRESRNETCANPEPSANDRTRSELDITGPTLTNVNDFRAISIAAHHGDLSGSR
jgi:hydroxypyruvate reductase